MLVAVACSSANDAAPAASAPVHARDALLWPFRSDSIWNTPIGDGASYVAAAITSSTGLDPDEDVLILTPTAPVVPVYEHTAGWDASTTRCANVTPKVLMSVPIPADFRTDPGYLGASPNAAAAVMLADGRTVRQMQPFHRCADGRAVAQYVFDDDDLVGGTGLVGAHGGSGMSSIGGTIRVGELNPGGRIRHALKIEVFARRFLALRQDSTPGYRWPASSADSYAQGGYQGSIPALEMGALVALRPDFDVKGLTTEPARILAAAFRDYGAYIVDDTAEDVVAVATEWGPAGRVSTGFKANYGYGLDTALDVDCRVAADACAWRDDVRRIVASLAVVDNNAPGSVGGPGKRRVACAPPVAGAPSTEGPGCARTDTAPPTTNRATGSASTSPTSRTSTKATTTKSTARATATTKKSTGRTTMAAGSRTTSSRHPGGDVMGREGG